MNNQVKLWYQGTFDSFMSTPTLEVEYDDSTDVLSHRFIPDSGRGEANDKYWAAQKLDDCDVTAIKELLRDKKLIIDHINQTSSRPEERRGAHFVTDRICIEYLGALYPTERPTKTELLDRIVAIYDKYTHRRLYGDKPRKGLSLFDYLDDIEDPEERERIQIEIEEDMAKLFGDIESNNKANE